jgi:DNA-binding transcriptional regulator YdaS (Cro superfamily)
MDLATASNEDAAVSKAQFAKLVGVSAPRVSQWLSAGQINGDAIVGEGRHARLRPNIALAQLRARLDIDQRIANGRARLELAAAAVTSTAAPVIDDRIKAERLAQLELANEKAREDAAARAGAYVRSDGVRQEMGRLVGRLVTMFDSALVEFSTAIAARSDLSSRDALHLLRGAWRSIRERGAEHEQALAHALPGVVGSDSASPETANVRPPVGASPPSEAEASP